MATAPLICESLCDFRNVQYRVRAEARADGLHVFVQDPLVQDAWLGEFPVSQLEELTRKTGSFKPFAVFFRMLEASLRAATELAPSTVPRAASDPVPTAAPSVTLDLLTYADLQDLRTRRSGVLAHSVHPLNSSATGELGASSNAAFTNKRYLILTYHAEYDRVHYPLPLAYRGHPDPEHLKALVHQLHTRLQHAERLVVSTDHKTPSSSRQHGADAAVRLDPEPLRPCESCASLQAQVTTVQAENKSLRALLDAGVSGNGEVSLLRSVLANLEGDLVAEKSKYQRLLHKKTLLCEELQGELDDARAAEQRLRLRCRTLLEERSTHLQARQNSHSSRAPGLPSPVILRKNAATSPALSSSQSQPRTRGASVERPPRPSPSAAAAAGPRARSRSHERQRDTTVGNRGSSRSPSPVGRFDPTAFVKAREEKLRLQQKHKTPPRHSPGPQGTARPRSVSPTTWMPSANNARRRSPSPGAYGREQSRVARHPSRSANSAKDRSHSTEDKAHESFSTISRHSSEDSVDELIAQTARKGAAGPQQRRFAEPGAQSAAAPPGKVSLDLAASTGGYFQKSAEMSGISARLKALQEFLKTTATAERSAVAS